MKVTAIKQQAKRHDRYSVFVDGKYSFSLSEAQLVASRLHGGKELTVDEVAQYHDTSAEGKLFDKLLNLFSYRMRSEWEVRDYLRRQKAPDEQISRLIERLSGLGYVDDKKFAAVWAESRQSMRPTSRRKLRAELMAKRIAPEIIDQVLRDEAGDERDALHQVIAKKRARYPDQQKFMQYLARQGFSYDDIRAVLAELE